MDKIIVIKNSDGTCAIVYPCPKAKGAKESVTAFLKRIAPQAAGDRPWRIASLKDIPADRTFRNAWTDDNPTKTVDVHIEKAKALHVDSVRRLRDARWQDFDRRYTAAQRDGADLTALKMERQALKDAPQVAVSSVASATSAEELVTVMPEVMKP